MKKIFILCITALLCFSAINHSVFAERYTNCAETLNYMGVFSGVADSNGEIDYELTRGATRSEALVMLIRLLGEADTASSCTSTHNFSDVPNGNWAYPYVAYAVDKGYTAGTTPETFSPTDVVNIKSYATFLLRTLGYNDAKGDFSYNDALKKAEEIGLIPAGTYGNGDDVCLRDDCVYMSLRALITKMNNSTTTLAESLTAKGVIPADSQEKAKDALAIADQHLTRANLSPNPIKPESHLAYSEYENGAVIKRMEHIVYYNPFAKSFYHYTYDNDVLVNKMITDGADASVLYEFDVDDEGIVWSADKSYFSDYSQIDNLIYELRGVSFEESYSYEYFTEDNSLAGIFVDEDEENYISIDYKGDSIYITFWDSTLDDVLYLLDALEIGFFNADKAYFIDKDTNKTVCTIVFNDMGNVVKKLDKDGRVTYSADIDDDGNILKETVYTYATISNSTLADIGAGSNSITTYDYHYDQNGDLSNVIWSDGNESQEFSFRYFGNGKLDRILCKFDDGGIWEQVNTEFDEYGHMAAPNWY